MTTTKHNCPKCGSCSVKHRVNGTVWCQRCGYNEVLSRSGQKRVSLGYLNVSEESSDALGRYMVEHHINEQEAALDAILLEIAKEQQKRTEEQKHE